MDTEEINNMNKEEPKNMDEEVYEPVPIIYEPISVCKCLRPDSELSDVIEIPERKQRILTTVARTEEYLRTRRIPELIRYLFTKVLTEAPAKPVKYLENLMDDCMLFRAGLGSAPVIYEKRHLEAVIKSFDPGNRGWLTSGQIRRLYTTIGLRPQEPIEERVPCDVVLTNLILTQEEELYDVLSAGTVTEEDPLMSTDSNF